MLKINIKVVMKNQNEFINPKINKTKEMLKGAMKNLDDMKILMDKFSTKKMNDNI